MGNASGREADGGDQGMPPGSDYGPHSGSVDAMGGISSTAAESPQRSRSPLMFAPQVPVAPLQRGADMPLLFNQQLWMNEPNASWETPHEKGIPTLITWNYGGVDVLVEGSWDNWRSRKALQKSAKDHAILLVLPSGVYQYRFLVDGEWRFIPDLPCVSDEMGNHTNVLDVHDYVPENLESVSEFMPPPSPDSSYGRLFPGDEELAKEPLAVPPQLHLTMLGSQKDHPLADGGGSGGCDEASAGPKPQHVVLNHLFIEKGLGPKSLVALGLTHRFQSKYVTVVLYKPVTR